MPSLIAEANPKPETVVSNSEHFCRYLGLIALSGDRQTTPEHLEQQVVTELAESIDAEMGTHGEPIALRVIENELCDRDGRSMSKSAKAWSALQTQRAQRDSGLSWFARIAEIESLEHEDVLRFAQTANIGDSLTVISPFPEEAYANAQTKSTVANEGFRPDTKRSFIRIYEKVSHGIYEHIQSVDSSSLDIWNATVSQVFGTENAVTTEELLGMRFVVTSPNAQILLEQIAAAYDSNIGTLHGGSYRYGRNPGGSIEANAFVRANMDIVSDTITQLRAVPYGGHAGDSYAERVLYNSKALLHKRLKGSGVGVDVRSESHAAGAAAAAEGMVFYGCSGATSVIAAQASNITHEVSFSLMNGLEGVSIKQCPMCGQECFTAIRDKSSGRFYCTNKNCAGYSAQKIQAAYGLKSEPEKTFTESFADALIDLFSVKKKLPRAKTK